jgi:cell shape-determining protein MreD
MRIWILSFILLIAVLMESTFITIPLCLILLINFLVIDRKSWVFPAAFFSGMMLDILLLRYLGSTSLFFVTLLFIINLYEKKFETSNIYFVLSASFVGSFFYLIIFGIRLSLPQSIVAAFLGAVIFYIMTLLSRRENLDYKYRMEKQ